MEIPIHTTVKLPLYLSWRQLKDVVGWPYSRTQTGRLMFDPDYAHDAFPACRKLGAHRNSHPIWYTPAASTTSSGMGCRFRRTSCFPDGRPRRAPVATGAL